MKKTYLALKINWLILLLLCGLFGSQAFSQTNQPFSINQSPLPAPTEPINDFTGVLDETTKQTLNQRIKDFKANTNPQVVLAVAIVRTTGDRDIFDYSLAVARGWKIGSKEDDNPSALLFIAIDDRKYFTQVSRNLEDELPDGVVGQLQRQNLVPAFKQANYAKGVTDTIEAYIRTIEATGNGQQPVNKTVDRQNRAKKSSGGCSFMTCLIILFVLMLLIFSRFGSSNRNNRNRWGGGGGGFGGGSALPWIIGGVLNGMSNSSRGSSSDWGSSGSSGGGDWGGFGGGGDFGGGGAGGDW